MKTRLQQLFSMDPKRRGIVAVLTITAMAVLLGGCFAVTSPEQPDAVDAQTAQQMEVLAKRWCDAQIKGLAPIEADTLLGGTLKIKFDDLASGYFDVDETYPCQIDNLPMGITPDRAVYTVNKKDGTVNVQVHGIVNEVEQGTSRAWFAGMTQTQTLLFGQEDGELRIVGYQTDDAMLLDHPDLCLTADDVVRIGMPEDPVETDDLEALVYLNFPVAGGRYAVNDDMVVYTFADGTKMYFIYEIDSAQQRYRLKEIVEPQENEQDSRINVPVVQAVNQWAEGYLRENAMFRYPFMTADLQKQFVQDQQASYGAHWFWRIGWGSSPDVTDWMLTDITQDGATVIYDLEAGGEHYRYAERFRVDTKQQIPVVTDYVVQIDSLSKTLSREDFLTLYPPESENDHLYPLMLNPDEDYIKERPDRFTTPEKALRAAIAILNEESYQIVRVSEEIPVADGVQMDLKIVFPDQDEVYITMYKSKESDQNGNEIWTIERIWQDLPDHSV